MLSQEEFATFMRTYLRYTEDMHTIPALRHAADDHFPDPLERSLFLVQLHTQTPLLRRSTTSALLGRALVDHIDTMDHTDPADLRKLWAIMALDPQPTYWMGRINGCDLRLVPDSLAIQHPSDGSAPDCRLRVRTPRRRERPFPVLSLGVVEVDERLEEEEVWRPSGFALVVRIDTGDFYLVADMRECDYESLVEGPLRVDLSREFRMQHFRSAPFLVARIESDEWFEEIISEEVLDEGITLFPAEVVRFA